MSKLLTSNVAQFPRLSIVDIAKLIPLIMSKSVSITDILWIAGCIATTFDKPLVSSDGSFGEGAEVKEAWKSIGNPNVSLSDFALCVEEISSAITELAEDNCKRLAHNEKCRSAKQLAIVEAHPPAITKVESGYIPPPIPGPKPQPIPAPVDHQPSPIPNPFPNPPDEVKFNTLLLIPIIQAILKLISLFRK